jgi:hypothetical protein
LASVAASLKRTADGIEASHTSSVTQRASAGAAIYELKRKNDIALSMWQLEAFRTLFGQSSTASNEQRARAEDAMRSILLKSLINSNVEQASPSSPTLSPPKFFMLPAIEAANVRPPKRKRIFKSLFAGEEGEVGSTPPSVSGLEIHPSIEDGAKMDSSDAEREDSNMALFASRYKRKLTTSAAGRIAENVALTAAFMPSESPVLLSDQAFSFVGSTKINTAGQVTAPEIEAITQSGTIEPLSYGSACAVGTKVRQFVGQELDPQSYCQNKACSSRKVDVKIHDACAYNVWSTGNGDDKPIWVEGEKYCSINCYRAGDANDDN